MTEVDADLLFLEWLRRTNLTRRQLDADLEPLGFARAAILVALNAAGGSMRTTHLLIACGLNGGSMVELVDRLVEGGQVTRERRSADRRVIDVVLTPAGEADYRAVRKTLSEIYNSSFKKEETT